MERHLLMSCKELARKSILELVLAGQITLVEASRRMGLSYRQALRVKERFERDGDSGLVHRGRGQPSNRGYPVSFRAKVLQRYRQRYKDHDIGPTLAAEKLAQDGLQVDHETLRRWLLEQGDWKKHRKRREHRAYRERKGHFGELVQMDGSHHHWFTREHDRACLMNMVDDATGTTAGLMAPQETTEAAMRLLWRWIQRYGIPMALYTDRKNVYITEREPTLEEQLADEHPMTAFGKACHKLGIDIITAHSPQAKGRVERSNGTYQDRFVKELALRRITTIASADALLENGFVEGLNAKFAKPPLEQQDYHRVIAKGLDLNEVFCFETHRVVQNDWTIRHENRYYQIVKENKPLPKPKDKVLVRTHLDGQVQLLYRQTPLAFQPISPKQLHGQRQQQAKAPAPATKTKVHKPPRAPYKHWRPNAHRLAARMHVDTK